MTVVGCVAFWRAEDGWGVVESVETPGGCWAHFSAIEMEGYRELHSGQEVDLDWEPAHQDGYRFRARSVRPHGRTPGLSPAANRSGRSRPVGSDAFGSSLIIDWDEPSPT